MPFCDVLKSFVPSYRRKEVSMATGCEVCRGRWLELVVLILNLISYLLANIATGAGA